MTARRATGDRAATAVEYALGMALFVVLVMGGLQAVQDGSEDKLSADRDAIAQTEHLGTVSATTSTPSTVPGPTTTASTTTTEATTTTSTAPTTTTLPPTLQVSCSAATCTFNVGNPPSGAAYAWTGPAPIGGSTSAVVSHTRAKNAGGYSVTVTLQPSGWTATRSVTCSQGNNTTCAPG